MQVCSFRLGSARYDSRLWNNSWSQELYYIVLRMYRSSLLGKAGMSVLRSYSFHLYQLIQLPLVSKAAQGQSWQETTQLSERGVAPQYLRIPYSQHSNRLSETGTSRLLRILNNHSKNCNVPGTQYGTLSHEPFILLVRCRTWAALFCFVFTFGVLVRLRSFVRSLALLYRRITSLPNPTHWET